VGIYFPSDGSSPVLISVAGAKGIGAEPSPTITITAGAVLVGAPLTAVMAPASIKLAKAPTNIFFTVRILLRQIGQIELSARKTVRKKLQVSQ
jgi:hypothetical protein